MPAKLFAYKGISNKVTAETPGFGWGTKPKEAFISEFFPILGWEYGVLVISGSSFRETQSERGDLFDQLHAFGCLDWIYHGDSSIKR
jgi:hypothetical protein